MNCDVIKFARSGEKSDKIFTAHIFPEEQKLTVEVRARRASLRPRDAERGWWFSIRRGDRRRHVIDHVHYRSVRPASDLTIREAIAAADELRTSDPLGEAWSKSATDVMAAAAGEGTLVVRNMTWPGIG